jgi:hypothetical protein
MNQSPATPVKKNKTAIALLTRNPVEAWVNFLKDFKNYDVFFIVDDNIFNYTKLYERVRPQINFVQIDNKICESLGYKYANTVFMPSKKVIAWDKAFYYFGVVNTNYDDVWFIEDDVFFKSENDLLNIDARYNSNQVLTKSHMSTENGQHNGWFWPRLKIHAEMPYFKCMVCACRLSRSLFESIDNYVKKQGELFFIEALIPTLTRKNNLSHAFVKELETIHYDKKWEETDFLTPNNLYHPAKKFDMHKELRNKYTKY